MGLGLTRTSLAKRDAVISLEGVRSVRPGTFAGRLSLPSNEEEEEVRCEGKLWIGCKRDTPKQPACSRLPFTANPHVE